ncbi:MAG: MogA/MoaB family molybdenum cofactor biosynthesis protein [Candidatus Kariarchaeaceae archaeon]|jgi:molybdenum cofactor biosynthesis protein B
MTWTPHENVSFSDLKASVVIVSDSLFSGENDITNDLSGPVAVELLTDAGIDSVNLDYYPDEVSALQSKVESDVQDNIDIVIFIGGTGISPRDVTIEAVASKLFKELPGFGEEFRRRSIEQIHGRGILSRAICGVVSKSLVVTLPGSPKAVELGLEIVLSFLGHAVNLVK